LIADGGEACGGDAESAADAVFDAGVPVHVIGFAVSDGGVAAELGAIATAGGTSSALFVDDATALAAALDAIADESTLVEICNGLDDDCDGFFDEEFPHLGDPCDNGLTGACHSSGSLVCAPAGDRVECVISEPEPPPSVEQCNGLDDDCDGAVDEDGVCLPAAELCNGADDDGDELVDEDFPVGQPCSTGTGACRATGLFACRGDALGVTCVPSSPPAVAKAFDVTCDGVDDDCDGAIDDEAYDEMVAVDGFAIDRYEASRPDATATSPGWRTHRACSKPGVVPWSGVQKADAALACAAAGKRLCSASEWQSACAGPSNLAYPYGNLYEADSCNGADLDPDCVAPNDDVAVVTGAPLGCPAPTVSVCVAASGAADLSGNLAEWTSTAAGVGRFEVRGGAYDSPAPALSCLDDGVGRDGEAFGPALGFRCCADEVPPRPAWIFSDGFESSNTAAWSATLG
jgi:hypothetical protein